MLSLLLLHRGEVLSTDRLIDELWGEHPPTTVVKAPPGYVSRLRKALGDDVVQTRGQGYGISLLGGQLDLDRLGEALALWRGPPLSDFTYEPFAQREIGRLEEARIAVLEDWIDAERDRAGARIP